ncbi:hypothetical protein ACOJQI_18755 [Bacillus salacetis]|uniref:hypothetical protein n=1 Tax=Bacillus salacetis TaxID=2315464 RepID=UPI003BA2BEA7
MDIITIVLLLLLQAAGVIYLHSKPAEEETNLFLKLIGYSILGSFSFGINQIKLPVGFAVFLLFFKPSMNTKVKKQAALQGLAIFLLSISIPFLQKTIYEWPRKVQLENKNFYSMNLSEEWERIREELDAPSGNYSSVDYFDTVIDKEGNLVKFELSLTEQQNEGFVHYLIELDGDKDWRIKRYRVSDWMMTPESQEAGDFLRHLDDFSPGVLDDQSIKYYWIKSDARMTAYAIRDQKKYVLTEDGKEEIENEQLPVDGVYIEVCGSTGGADEHGNIFDCSLNEHYLYNVTFRGLDVNEGNILELARKHPEVDQWFSEHLGEAIGLERNGTYILRQDGKETKVTEQEYIRVLKETPFVTIDQHENYWTAVVENPYGDAPHTIEVRIDSNTGEVIDFTYQ